MQILFKPLAVRATGLQDHALGRTRFVFRRFAGCIPKATILLSDVNGPRGGIDKRCQVEIKAERIGTLVTSGVASDWRASIDHALARAARLLARLARKRSASRRRRP